MRLLVINPNSTEAMTASIAGAARAAANPGTKISAVTSKSGPPAIQGAEDGEAALPGLFATFDAEVLGEGRYDAVIIACFDDTGLWELKRRSPIPVLGIGEAGFLAAGVLGVRYSVITTLPVSLPVIEQNIVRYGFERRCVRVRASGIPVLAFENDKKAACEALSAEIATAVREDGCDVVVLGCAGMADLVETLQQRHSITIIDGVAAAVGLCEGLLSAVGYRLSA